MWQSYVRFVGHLNWVYGFFGKMQLICTTTKSNFITHSCSEMYEHTRVKGLLPVFSFATRQATICYLSASFIVRLCLLL